MKPTLLTFALFILWSDSCAQFINENKQWNVRQEENFGPIKTFIYKINGDTVINGLSYKTMWANENSLDDSWYVAGYLREETNRVYYLEDSQEGLLYDFNLNAGDTTYVVSKKCMEPEEKIVISTDTVDYYGIPRIRWVFNDSDWDVWIEGVGSLFGPLNSIFPCYTDIWVNLLCYYENDSVRYINETYNECYLTSVGIFEDYNLSDIQVSPNPSQKGSLIEIRSGDLIHDLELLSFNGLVIKHYHDLESKSVTIYPGSLLPGIYLLKVSDKIHRTQVLKVVIF